MPMGAGAMREQITIQQRTITRDAFGAAVESWSTLASVWANVKAQRAATALESMAKSTGRETVRAQYIVTTWYRTDVSEVNRLTWGSYTLDIRRVADPDGSQTHLELLAEVAP